MTGENISLEDFEKLNQTYDIIGVTDSEFSAITRVMMSTILSAGSVMDESILMELVSFSLKMFDAKEAGGHEFPQDFQEMRIELEKMVEDS